MRSSQRFGASAKTSPLAAALPEPLRQMEEAPFDRATVGESLRMDEAGAVLHELDRREIRRRIVFPAAFQRRLPGGSEHVPGVRGP